MTARVTSSAFNGPSRGRTCASRRDRSVGSVLAFFGVPLRPSTSGLGRLDVPIAHLRDCDARADLIAVMRRILACRHFRQLDLRALARLFDSDRAEGADLQPALPTAVRAKFGHELFRARGEDANSEPL